MNLSLQEIKKYYDERAACKLRDFVEGNPRTEQAWLTIQQWSPKNPQQILEVGCGVGYICWWMTRYWPQAEVVGIDISLKSLKNSAETIWISQTFIY